MSILFLIVYITYYQYLYIFIINPMVNKIQSSSFLIRILYF